MIPPKKITIEDHEEFRHSLLIEADYDELDELLDPCIQPSQTRSSREIQSLLSILDAIGKEGSC